jgi:hypothetical protein
MAVQRVLHLQRSGLVAFFLIFGTAQGAAAQGSGTGTNSGTFKTATALVANYPTNYTTEHTAGDRAALGRRAGCTSGNADGQGCDTDTCKNSFRHTSLQYRVNNYHKITHP